MQTKIIDGLKIEAGKLYFRLDMGWHNIFVPMTDKTAMAVALLFEQGVAMRSSWVEGGGAFVSPFSSEGCRISTPEVRIMQGRDLLSQLALAPENRNPVALPDSIKSVVDKVNESESSLTPL